MKWIILFLVMLNIYSCDQFAEDVALNNQKNIDNESSKSITIQPLGNIPIAYISYIQNELNRLNKNVVVENAIPLPTSCFYKTRNRYRADSLIKFLQKELQKTKLL